MKVRLVGKRYVDYKRKTDGRQVKGWDLHILSAVVEKPAQLGDFEGQRVSSEFVSQFDCSVLVVGKDYDFVFDKVMGTDRIRLVAATPL